MQAVTPIIKNAIKRKRKMNEWLTMKQAQELLHYTSRNAVYNYCKIHGIRATKPRGRIYFNRADINNVFGKKAVIMGV